MTHELLVRLVAFGAIFAGVAWWEILAGARSRICTRWRRWPHNLGLLALDIAVLRITLPGAAIAVALAGESGGWGLLRLIDLPGWAGFVLSVVLLDLTIYFQHVVFHALPTLWRLHRVHHSDVDVDLTTGTRFHPVEIVISMIVKAAAVVAIGASPEAVLVFEVLLNATAIFNHASARLPQWLERVARGIVVTPDMHRIHHSINYNESASNFGFNLPWWDRLFGTYLESPAAGHAAITFGVDAFREPEDIRLERLLLQPIRDTPGGYAINRRPESPSPRARA